MSPSDFVLSYYTGKVTNSILNDYLGIFLVESCYRNHNIYNVSALLAHQYVLYVCTVHTLRLRGRGSYARLANVKNVMPE
jgi:hypothetical protein